MGTKIYKIAVEIAAVNSLGPVLKVLSRDFLGLGSQANALTSKLWTLRMAAVGASAALGGIAILKGAYGLAQYGAQVSNASSRLAQMGVTAKNVAAVSNAAFKAAQQTPNVTWSEAVSAVTKGRTVLGSSAEAIKAAPLLVRTEGILDNWGMGGPTALAQLLKAVELAGGIYGADGKTFSVKALGKSLKYALEAQDIAGKLLTPAVIMQSTKLAGAAARLMNPFAWWSGMAEAVQQMGPSGGRGFAMAMKEFSGGPISRLYAYNLEKYGLVHHDGFIHIPHSFQTAIKPGALKGSKILYSQGLFAWVNKILVPTLEAHGVHGTKALLAAVYQTISSQTGSRLVANMITNQLSYERTQEQMKQAGNAPIYQIQRHSMNGAQAALRGSWHRFLQVLGTPLVAPAIRALNALTNAVIGVTAWAKIHPVRIKLIMEGIAGLGVALAVIGTVTVVAALATLGGIPALIAGVVTALATALTIIIANFNDFQKGLENIFSIGGSKNHAHMHLVNERRGRYMFPVWVPDAGYNSNGASSSPSTSGSTVPTVHLSDESVHSVAYAIKYGINSYLVRGQTYPVGLTGGNMWLGPMGTAGAVTP